jgi:hypothetical protein
MRILGWVTVLFCLAVPAVGEEGETMRTDATLFSPPSDLVEGIPQDFPRFFFLTRGEEARYLNRYLWHHYSARGGVGKTLFNKEYLTLSDMWLTADSQRSDRPIQEAFRERLLSIQIDPEGYVHTHQHFSHAHDFGWPFPLWPQVPGSPKGITMGWHFQEDGPDWQWLWPMMKAKHLTSSYGQGALEGWELENIESEGIVDGKWKLAATGPSPAIVTPAGAEIEAFNSPFLQLRWTRTGERKNHALPYIEWMREGENGFGPDRRVHFDTQESDHQGVTKVSHSIVPMYRHPKWDGKIIRMRISLAPGEDDVEFSIDSFFTVYDTRHTINNPIFILASWNYFRWTGDIAFLRENINRMRTALRYQQTVMGGLEHNFIRVPWVGHDGLPSYTIGPHGEKTFNPGHGIGNNYWDIMPFGGDDMYATSQYYSATVTMAEIEESILKHPGWGVPRGALTFDAEELREHAAEVKKAANGKFWNKEKGRFVASVDTAGVPHEYGYTFLNLDSIWYGIASDEHAASIMDWITGKRIVDGDTSTGDDIYHWRFGPRATTLRNLDWYGQGWTRPEGIPWGGQVQDGGAVLGFSFYDLWARLHLLGADNAWQRFSEILEWEREVWAEGGYREYYKDGKRGTTMQGCGTAGGLGIDCEFYESSLLPCIVTYGFLGLDPGGAVLRINPLLPKACPRMGVSNVHYRGVRLDIEADRESGSIAIRMKDRPVEAITIVPPEGYRLREEREAGFLLEEPGVYRFGP